MTGNGKFIPYIYMYNMYGDDWGLVYGIGNYPHCMANLRYPLVN